MGRQKQATPMKGAIVKMRNGMQGEVIGVKNPGSYGEEFEVLVDGIRCYVDANEVKVVNVLDRIATEISKED